MTLQLLLPCLVMNGHGRLSLTQMLQRYSGGDTALADIIWREVWPRLRRSAATELARDRRPGRLSPTELTHEYWMRSFRQGGWPVRDREHFHALAARAMRHVLVDLARRRLAQRRGNGESEELLESSAAQRVYDAREASPEQVIALGALMDKLEREQPQVASTVDMHYYGGLTLEEIAQQTGLSQRQVRHSWNKGRDWLRKRLAN